MNKINSLNKSELADKLNIRPWQLKRELEPILEEIGWKSGKQLFSPAKLKIICQFWHGSDDIGQLLF